MALHVTVVATTPWGERHEFKAKRLQRGRIGTDHNGEPYSFLKVELPNAHQVDFTFFDRQAQPPTNINDIRYELGENWREELGEPDDH